jgi:KRAB domain-containing zinc finger protein
MTKKRRKHIVEIHEDGKKLLRTCQPCQLAFKLYNNHKSHIFECHDNELFCESCGIELESQYKYNFHKRSHKITAVENRKFVCDICGHRCSKKGLMVTHMRNHTKETPFICDICGKGFKAFAPFAYHKKTHTGLKDQVRIVFYTNTNFKELSVFFRFVNIVVKAFTCLKNHIKTAHTALGLLTRKCYVYGMVFSTKNYLQDHLQTHAVTRKEIICDYCLKMFKMKTYLASHIKKEHPEKLEFQCHICNEGFRHRHLFDKHVMTKH